LEGKAPLTFAALEEKLRKSQRSFRISRNQVWPWVLNVVSVMGVMLAFLWPTWIGLSIAIAACVPFVIYASMVMAKDFKNLLDGQARQLDCEHTQFWEAVIWLRNNPTEELQTRLVSVRNGLAHRVAKIGLLAGSIEKIGVVPVLAGMFLLFHKENDFGVLAYRLAVLGSVLTALWGVCMIAAWSRGRLQLYEKLLEEALKASSNNGVLGY